MSHARADCGVTGALASAILLPAVAKELTANARAVVASARQFCWSLGGLVVVWLVGTIVAGVVGVVGVVGAASIWARSMNWRHVIMDLSPGGASESTWRARALGFVAAKKRNCKK